MLIIIISNKAKTGICLKILKQNQEATVNLRLSMGSTGCLIFRKSLN